MWPSRTTWEHYSFVLEHSAFRTFFKEQRHRLGFDGGGGDDLRLSVRLCAVTL